MEKETSGISNLYDLDDCCNYKEFFIRLVLCLSSLEFREIKIADDVEILHLEMA